MGEFGALLEDLRDQLQPDEGAFERIVEFRRRRHLRQRITAATLAFALAGVAFVALAAAFRGQSVTPIGMSPTQTQTGSATPTALGRYLPPSFVTHQGWNAKDSGPAGNGSAMTAWASTIAFTPADLSPLAPAIPVKTIEALPPDGIIITAEVTPWAYDPASGPYPPGALHPLDLSRATLRGPQAEEPPGRYSVLEIDKGYVLVRVYLNATDPSPALIARAQAELDTLRIPPVCPVPASGPYGATASSDSGIPGDNITITGPMPFQREDGSFDQTGDSRMVAWWNASPGDWAALLSTSSALPSPAGAGPLIRLGQGGVGACAFSIDFVVPNVPPGDYQIVVIQEGGGGSTLEATIVFHALAG